LTTLAVAMIVTSIPNAAIGQAPAGHPGIQPRTFESAEAAAGALIDAASKNDTGELTAILGSTAQDILTSGNTNQDREERLEFSKLAAAKYLVEHSSIDSAAAVVLVGNDEWPFPIPLIRDGQKWHFDPDLGAFELRARRIGENELDTIEVCAGYVGAQEAYATQALSAPGTHAYSQKIMGSSGGKDGLYRSGTAAGAFPPLVPEDFAMAEAISGGHGRKPFHGYYFRILKQQGPNAPGGAHKYIAGNAMIGGFGLIAWPAEYGTTGVHTFIVNQDGQIFEKDFGPRTTTLIPSIMWYDPDGSWAAVE
jgi:hypothetical protein